MMMPSTSKSNRRNPKNQPRRNWLELSSDVMANILFRVGVIDILENAQKVCTAWRKICKDPSMWRVIEMDNFWEPSQRPPLQDMCKHAVDRSKGQLVDITIVDFCNDELLQYVADRSSQLRRLEISCCYGDIWGVYTEALKKFPLLEELTLNLTEISKEDIEGAGRYCPMLKTLKVNSKGFRSWDRYPNEVGQNEIAIAIGENLHELRHLELTGDGMTNIGLKSLLDGCRHLETLDLRECWYVDLKGELGKRCLEKIKCVRQPYDSIEDCPYICNYGNDSQTYVVSSYEPKVFGKSRKDVEDSDSNYDDDDDSDDEYYEYLDYNDFRAYGFGYDSDDSMFG